jgi:hypothetical protein
MVDVNERLPSERVICFRGEKRLLYEWNAIDFEDLKITHWLEKKSDMIVLTKEEFKTIAMDLLNKGEEITDNNTKATDGGGWEATIHFDEKKAELEKTEYINNLLK